MKTTQPVILWNCQTCDDEHGDTIVIAYHDPAHVARDQANHDRQFHPQKGTK